MQVAFKIKMIMHGTLHSRKYSWYINHARWFIFKAFKSHIFAIKRSWSLIYLIISFILFQNMNPGLTYFFKCQRKKNKYFYFSHDMNILTRGQKILAPHNRKCNLTICFLYCWPKEIIHFPSRLFWKTNFEHFLSKKWL